MMINRTTHSVTLNTGISMAQYNEAPAGQTAGQTQRSIVPGSTTVSQALESVFPKDATISGQILGMLANEGNSVLLRTSNGFRAAAKRTIRTLKGKKGSARAERAAQELENLLEDTELLDQYRAALLES